MVESIDTVVYAGRIKDRNVLNSSSSGGTFTAISDFVLEHGDAVVAAIQWLIAHTDKRLLFVGTGCQAEGFRQYMEVKKFEIEYRIMDC